MLYKLTFPNYETMITNAKKVSLFLENDIALHKNCIVPWMTINEVKYTYKYWDK